MGGIRGFFGFKPVSSNNIDNPPPRPPPGGGGGTPANGKGGSLYSFDRGNGKSSFMQLASDFGKGTSPTPTPTRTMRKG